MENFLDKLSWDNDKESQQEAIKKLSIILTEKDIDSLILPNGRKDCWDNTAIIIEYIIDKHNIKKLDIDTSRKLLFWLADLNWPGATRIMETMLRLDAKFLSKCIILELENAINKKDLQYVEGLSYLISKIRKNYFDDIITHYIINDFNNFKSWLLDSNNNQSTHF